MAFQVGMTYNYYIIVSIRLTGGLVLLCGCFETVPLMYKFPMVK